MDTKYFVGEIDLPNGIRKDLIMAKDINSAHDIIESHIKRSHMDFDQLQSDRERSTWILYRPIGSFIVRPATTKEILEDILKDFVNNWNDCSIEGMTEEIIETVITTISRKALEEEIQKRNGEDVRNFYKKLQVG